VLANASTNYLNLDAICFFFQAEDGIRDDLVTGVQTCALPICLNRDKIRAAIAATDMDGTRGRIRFDGQGDPTFETHIVKIAGGRSEERRVGKEWRWRGAGC